MIFRDVGILYMTTLENCRPYFSYKKIKRGKNTHLKSVFDSNDELSYSKLLRKVRYHSDNLYHWLPFTEYTIVLGDQNKEMVAGCRVELNTLAIIELCDAATL